MDGTCEDIGVGFCENEGDEDNDFEGAFEGAIVGIPDGDTDDTSVGNQDKVSCGAGIYADGCVEGG